MTAHPAPVPFPDTPAGRAVVTLASQALSAALAKDWAEANRCLQRIGDDHGGDGVLLTLLGLTDALLAAYDRATGQDTITHPRPVALAFWNLDTGESGDAVTVDRPDVLWVGRFVAARAANDEATGMALLDALPPNVGDHVATLLQSTALTIELAARDPAALFRPPPVR